MKKAIYVLLFVLPIINSAQNYSIHGKIINAKTKKPLFGVNVYIPSIHKGTTTNTDGFYKISNIKTNKIKILFSLIGFKEQQLKVNFDQTQKEFNVSLEEAVFELDEVILSTPFNKLQKDNVVKVSHKSVKAMEKQGIQSLMQGITQIAGVSKISVGTGIDKPIIRGLTGSRVLVYNQGVRLENFQFGEKHGMGISESGIESVEIIKGPASLLYGSDAMGGVLYLEPEKYAKKNEIHAQLKSKYFSNTSGIETGLGIKTSGKSFKFLTRGTYNRNADYHIPNKQSVSNSRYQSKDLKVGIGFQNKKIQTDFRYHYNQGKNGLPVGLALTQPNYQFKNKYQNLTNHSASLKTDIKLKKSNIKTNIGYTAHQRILQVHEHQKIGMQLNTLNLDAKWYLPEYQHFESIIGFQGMLQNNRNFGEHYLVPDAKINNYAIFSTINYTLNETQFQAGIRYDARQIQTKDVKTPLSAEYRKGFDKKLPSFTGSFGLKTEPSEHIILRLNIASGFRAPNLAELASKGLHDNRIEIGNPALKNEQNLQTDINFEYQNTHIEFFVNTFYNKINRYIYLEPTGQTQNNYSIYQYRQNNARLYGGEIGIHLHPHPWDWLHFDSSFETVIGKRNESYLPLIPADQWKNQIRFTNSHTHRILKKYYLTIGVNHTFPSTKVSQFEKKRPAYTLLNTGFGANLKFYKTDIDLNLSIHNLFNKFYIGHLSVLREQEIPNMGRNIILTATLNL